MTVSELLDKLKDCAPNAQVELPHYLEENYPLSEVTSDGEKVVLS